MPDKETNTHKIILLISPFHLKQLKAFATVCSLDPPLTIASSSFVSVKDVHESFPNAKIYPFSSTELQVEPQRFFSRLANLLRQPGRTINYYRSIITKNRLFIKDLMAGIRAESLLQIIIFNDRDFLTQLVLNHVADRESVRVTAIDEGLGYYVREGLREYLLKIAYRIVTPLLLGFHYRFIEQYGTHPIINEVYVRFPDQLKDKKADVIYNLLPKPAISKVYQSNLSRPCVLLFSTMLSEDNYMSKEGEKEFYTRLIQLCTMNRISLAWKPHPRENESKTTEIESLLLEGPRTNFVRIPANVDSESIDFSSFDLIFNFGSTLILYIMESGFPPERIVNFRLSRLNLQTNNSITSVDFYKSSDKIRAVLEELASQQPKK